MEKLTYVEIFTDGACSGNPGPGGWGTILRCNGVEKELSGGEAETTNNRMELLAVINGLEALNRKCKVKIYSDSSYVVNGITKGWAEGWKANNWRKADKKEDRLHAAGACGYDSGQRRAGSGLPYG